MHQTSDDVRLTVGADGVATVQHHLRYRVVAGHFKTLDFTGVEPNAELVVETTALVEKGGELPAHVLANPKVPGARPASRSTSRVASAAASTSST